jgi:hypothetical protein
MYEFNSNNDYKVEVFVTKASGGEFASKLNGYFVVNDLSFKFSAIAFGRIGGHNINLKLSNLSINKLKKMNIDSEKLQLIIQRKLIEGDVNIQHNGNNIN